MVVILAFCAGVVVSSFGGYWMHRAEHWPSFKRWNHVGHHLGVVRHGWSHEYWTYLKLWAVPSAAVAVLIYQFSFEATVGWLLGSFGHMAFLAYVHELQHTDPNLIFWMRRPLHHFHHKYNQWKHNFGIDTALWDRLFGTYKDDPGWVRQKVPLKGLLSINWR